MTHTIICCIGNKVLLNWLDGRLPARKLLPRGVDLPPALSNKRKARKDTLFRASAETLLEIAADPKHLGAEIGFFAVLHSWGQNLLFHPHLHCVIPAGGLSPDHTRWIGPRYPFFLPVGVLSRVFRGKFVAGLKRRFQQHQLIFPQLSPAFKK